MNRISSAEFRKTYAKLTEPTVVTVNGHMIGKWLPGIPYDELPAEIERMLNPTVTVSVREENPVTQPLPVHFNSRPFTPVPKTRK